MEADQETYEGRSRRAHIGFIKRIVATTNRKPSTDRSLKWMMHTLTR
jgi:hypothetical protein